ncbi:MAG: hypothetical protein QG620_138 [Patescibacteria group bacterium]|nr:hypothetical protein [Patescibacteria group bacterium]
MANNKQLIKKESDVSIRKVMVQISDGERTITIEAELNSEADLSSRNDFLKSLSATREIKWALCHLQREADAWEKILEEKMFDYMGKVTGVDKN